MSGVLFLLDVIAFVIVVAWAYANTDAGASGEKGLLGLKAPPSEPTAGSGRTTPHWKRTIGREPRVASAGDAPAEDDRPTPGWRRRLERSPPGA